MPSTNNAGSLMYI